MKIVVDQAAQGELLFHKVKNIPKNLKRANAKDGRIIVGHSETGHHHSVAEDQAVMYNTENPMLSYLEVKEDHADLVHERPFDTHETLRLPVGNYEIRRQRESAPDGWRAVRD